ncbi:MAG: glycoside hydrolase family 57 protein [Limisphaerales bacterium]
MQGSLALVLHAHLPFVRHPEHERFLEESWLFEAITETYLPLLQLLGRWHKEGLPVRLTLGLTPVLCAMLRDPLLQSRYQRHLAELIDLAEKETLRTLWEKPMQELALFYRQRLHELRELYCSFDGNIVAAFRSAQDRGQIEIITSAATHALLPLLAAHRPSLRAQVLVGCDYYAECFGRPPRGIWLPECAYTEELEPVLKEAGLRWFIVDTHGLLQAQPRPRYGIFAPVLTGHGLAAFGRDLASAKQVWSREEGYPGDPRYRDFYRDIGFDLDWDYLKPYLAGAQQRSFTGLKYYRITGQGGARTAYERQPALQAAVEHAAHFLRSRVEQLQQAQAILAREPLIVAPYDAELFGHWWYEGPEFLDSFVRGACNGPDRLALVTPSDYLRAYPTHQVATPAASSWGEEGYWRVWLNETNAWIVPHLRVAEERMSELTRRFGHSGRVAAGSGDGGAAGAISNALRQAGRELLLAQASDWPFILRTGTSPGYARRRVTMHLLRFTRIYEQLLNGQIEEDWLKQIIEQDNLFPNLKWEYWAER